MQCRASVSAHVIYIAHRIASICLLYNQDVYVAAHKDYKVKAVIYIADRSCSISFIVHSRCLHAAHDDYSVHAAVMAI